MIRQRAPRQGTTIVEVLITIGLMALLASIGLINLAGRRNQSDLENTTREMVALLREAQSRAVAQSSSSAWGVHFENATSTSPFFALFTGTYGLSTVAGRRPLPGTVDFSTSSIPDGGSKEVVFALSTGLPASATSVVVFLLQDATRSSTVSVVSSGLVSF